MKLSLFPPLSHAHVSSEIPSRRAPPGDDWPLIETPSTIKSPNQPDGHRGIDGGCESCYERGMRLPGEGGRLNVSTP